MTKYEEEKIRLGIARKREKRAIRKSCSIKERNWKAEKTKMRKYEDDQGKDKEENGTN